ncbi:MAG: hypothetical protein HY801_13650 [Candidatus Lindowbacteria bacterium]|nr:hypothetical protein [Candidatus Lindowbacteria bacterium]
MFDWVVPTLILVASALVLNEIRVSWLLRKGRKKHLYEQLEKTINNMADETHNIYETLPALGETVEKRRETNASDRPASRIR